MAKYRLIFRGELAPGVSREEFVAHVARLLGEEIRDVERSFFGKRSVVIKETDDWDEARRYRDAFTEVGALLELRGAGERAQRPGRGRRRIGWILGLLVLLLVVAAAAAWYSQPLWRGATDPEVARAESALAGPGLAVLAHADVARAVALEKRFLGAGDAGALAAMDDGSLLAALHEAGIEPRASVHQAVVAAYAEGGELVPAAVVLGEFDPAAVRQALHSAYEPAEGSGDHVYFRVLDPETCEPSPILAAAPAADRVVVAPATRIEDVLRRYGEGRGSELDLAGWRRFRGDRLFSAGIFAPGKIGDSVGGMSGMMLRGASSRFTAVDSAFIGAAARALPPGINVSAEIHSADTDWIAQQHATARTALDSARQGLGASSPAVARLLERLELSRSPHRLGASIELDRDFRDQVAAALSDAIASAIGPGVVAGSTQGEERVVENPDRFVAQLSAADLPAFDAIEDSNFTAQWSDGPFGLRIKEAGIAPDDDGRAYLVLEAHGRELANVADDAPNVRLRVADVLDDGGESIMPQPGCGTDRNQDPVTFDSLGNGSYFDDGEFVEYRKHSAEKRVRLAPGAAIDSVQRIEGVIELDLPVRTAREVLEQPLAGKHVERNGARVAFKAASDGVLSFETSGDQANILAVRALNADGDVLDSRGESSMSRIFGAGKAINRNISGEIAQVEVIVATETQSLRYPFTLDTPYPRQGESDYVRPSPRTGEAAAMDEGLDAGAPEAAMSFNMQPQATATAGPVVLALQQLRTGGFYDFYARLRVRAPIVEGLGHNLSAGAVAIDSVAGAGDDWSELGLRRVFELSPQGMMVNGVFRRDEDRPFMEADVDVEGSYDGPEVKRLRGRVVLRLPAAMQTATLEPFRLGASAGSDALQLTPVALQAGSVRIAGRGDRDSLVGVHLLNEEGNRVDRGARFEYADDGGWSVRVSIGSSPAAMEIITADEFVERPFEFVLDSRQTEESG